MSESSNSKALAAALKYASQGVPVIPLHVPSKTGCSCGNTKCGSAGKHPRTRQGAKNATTDPKVIQGWWRQWPDANIGIATGNNLIVLDIDPRAGGTETLATLEAQHGPMPATAEVATGGGGRHLYFRAESSNGLRGRILGPGLELKAAGMLVVAPPSLHASGRQYVWATKAALAPAPAWLLTTQAAPTPPPPPTEPIPEGARNDTLFRLACGLQARGMSAEAILAALQEENARRCSPPLNEDEARKIAASATRYDPSTAPEHLTDLGNARRFVAMHHEDVRYCTLWGKWLVWDGTRWAPDETDAVRRLAKATVLKMYADAAREPDPALRTALATHAVRCEADAKLTALVHVAQSEPGLPARPRDLDADPWALNLLNGTLDLRTGELREHRRADLLTKLAPVVYDPTARCPLWGAALDRTFAGNRDTIRFVQRAAGYSLTGVVAEHVLLVLYGTGANGKTTIINTLVGLLGDYGSVGAPDLLLLHRGEVHPTGVADLHGRRLIAAMETDEQRRLAEGLVKRLTGGDPVKARRMREDYWQFEPTHKLWLTTNHKPEIRGTDHAIWRRVRLVPFNVTIPEAEQDPRLVERLKAERAGILRWAVEGCLAWQCEGLGMAEEVRSATAQYKAEMDTLLAFLTECCVAGRGLSATAKELYAAYTAWCEANGERGESNRGFGLRLRERGFIRKRVGGNVHTWFGLQVKPGPGGLGR